MNTLTTWVSSFWTREPRYVPLMMVGTDCAGKTTILCCLQYPDEVPVVTPTSSPRQWTIDYKDRRLLIWDVPGMDGYMRSWYSYYEASAAAIFVVNSTDRSPERVGWIKRGFDLLISCHLRDEKRADTVLLVYATMQDMKYARTVAEIRDLLGLTSLVGARWHIIGVSGMTGEGLHDGLEWLSTQLKATGRW